MCAYRRFLRPARPLRVIASQCRNTGAFCVPPASLRVIARQCAHCRGNPFLLPVCGRYPASINFSSLARRKVAKEAALRRGRFRFLPLLRTSLIETAKGARGPPLDSPGSGGKMVQKPHCLHHAAPSEASPRGNRGGRLFHDCTRFWRKGRTSAGISSKFVSRKPACKRPFLSCTGRGAVFLFGKTKRKIGGRNTQDTVCIQDTENGLPHQ